MLISEERLSRYSSAFLLPLREILRHKEPMTFRNREGFVAYDFALRGKTWKKGVSAMLRVKNEEGKILYCLSSILDVFDEIVLVDNGSTDSTLELVKRFKRDRDHRGKISLFSYPFRIARCGDENRNAPEDSVHTTAYYYNWSLSKCRYSYVFKVDADMVVVPNGARRMRTLFRGLSPFIPTIVNTPVQTTYRSLNGTWLLAKNEVYREPRLFPNTSAIHYCKAKSAERLICGIPAKNSKWSEILFYELKDTAENEFLHWTNTNFDNDRKRQEWKNFNLVKSGFISEEDFVEISPSFLWS